MALNIWSVTVWWHWALTGHRPTPLRHTLLQLHRATQCTRRIQPGYTRRRHRLTVRAVVAAIYSTLARFAAAGADEYPPMRRAGITNCLMLALTSVCRVITDRNWPHQYRAGARFPAAAAAAAAAQQQHSCWINCMFTHCAWLMRTIPL